MPAFPGFGECDVAFVHSVQIRLVQGVGVETATQDPDPTMELHRRGPLRRGDHAFEADLDLFGINVGQGVGEGFDVAHREGPGPGRIAHLGQVAHRLDRFDLRPRDVSVLADLTASPRRDTRGTIGFMGLGRVHLRQPLRFGDRGHLLNPIPRPDLISQGGHRRTQDPRGIAHDPQCLVDSRVHAPIITEQTDDNGSHAQRFGTSSAGTEKGRRPDKTPFGDQPRLGATGRCAI